MNLPLFNDSGAEFSDDEAFRYRLWRTWDAALDRVLWVMLNPSIAGAGFTENDPTINRDIKFSQIWGFGSLEVVNLYAYRTPHPKVLAQAIREHGHAWAVGPINDEKIVQACARAKTVVAAWGSAPFAEARARQVFALLREHHPNIVCLGTNDDGSPRHPMARGKSFLPYDTALEVFFTGT